MSSHLLPTDSGWTEDKNLIADLSTANAESSRYILRYLDVDAGQAEPISIDDEYAFGQRLINVGAQVRHRASQREEQANSSSALSYERSDTQPSDDKA